MVDGGISDAAFELRRDIQRGIDPLSPAAIDVLERAKQFHVTCSTLLFPGRDVRRPLSDMTLLKILRYAVLPFTA